MALSFFQFLPRQLLAIVIMLAMITSLHAQTETQNEIDLLNKRIDELERRLNDEPGVADQQAESAKQADEKQADRPVKFGGALRYNYTVRSDDQNQKNRYGDTGLDIFRINADGEFGKLFLSAEYRFYRYMDTIHHGYVGYHLSESSEIQLGIQQVPFGLLPYASHNFWFGVPYYLGLADDYDSGIKYKQTNGGWDTQLAFYKNEELGNASDLERYSYDPVNTFDPSDSSTFGSANEETNTINARLAYTFGRETNCSHEVGISGQAGQLYNTVTTENGDQWAVATHLDTHCGRWNFQLQMARYAYNPKNPTGVSSDTVTVGAFLDSYGIASRGDVYVANVAYNLPINWSGIQLLTCYNDFSMLDKDIDGFNDSYINTTGCLINSGPTYTYVDIIRGKNVPYFGGGSLGAGGNDDWETRFNINFGIYW